MDKEDVAHIYNGILLSHKKEQNRVICRDMDGLRDCHTEWNKSEREKQISYINTYEKIGIDDLIYKAEIETQMQRTNVWDRKSVV